MPAQRERVVVCGNSGVTVSADSLTASASPKMARETVKLSDLVNELYTPRGQRKHAPMETSEKVGPGCRTGPRGGKLSAISSPSHRRRRLPGPVRQAGPTLRRVMSVFQHAQRGLQKRQDPQDQWSTVAGTDGKGSLRWASVTKSVLQMTGLVPPGRPIRAPNPDFRRF